MIFNDNIYITKTYILDIQSHLNNHLKARLIEHNLNSNKKNLEFNKWIVPLAICSIFLQMAIVRENSEKLRVHFESNHILFCFTFLDLLSIMNMCLVEFINYVFENM